MGVINGCAVGAVVGLVAWLATGLPYLGLVIAPAMLLNLICINAAGVMVPFTLGALNIDPALASSIFVTTVAFVLGFLFLLGLAAVFIPYLG